LGAATAYKAVTAGGDMVSAFGLDAILIGFVTSSVAAFIAVKWMVGYLNRRGMHIFAVWRIGLAVVVGGMLLGQVIQ
jgi:undecaprenyl-diphosphatase